MSYMTELLKYEPVRIAALVVVVAVSILTTAGVAIPAWAVAVAGAIGAELARRQVTPVPKARVQQLGAYHKGQVDALVSTSRRIIEGGADG